MSYTQAFATLIGVGVGIVLLIWILWRGWAPELLPQWAGIVWGLIAAMLIFPNFLPPSIRWSDTVNLIKVFIFGVALIYSVKSLFVLIRHYGSMSGTQRISGYLGAAPLVLSILGIIFTFWAMGGFHQTKK